MRDYSDIDNDLLPLLVPSDEEKEEKKNQEDDFYRKDLKNHSEKEKIVRVAIRDILENEPREEWKEAIQSTQCFVRLWYDEDDKSFCTELECPLRRICEGAWERVLGKFYKLRKGHPKRIANLTVASTDFSVELNPQKEARFARIKKPYTYRKNKDLKYVRLDYVPSGRPIDYLAQDLWEFLGRPILLPSGWSYNSPNNDGVFENAKVAFVKKFGTILCVMKRSSYHLYYFDGEQLMRFWVNTSKGGWLDLNVDLSKIFLTNGVNLAKAPEGSAKKFRFFPFRFYVSKDEDLLILKEYLTKLKGMEYLKDRLSDAL